MTVRNLYEYAQQCKNELEAIGIKCGYVKEFIVNTRARKRWGQCKKSPDGFAIEIAAVLLDEKSNEIGLKETIIHELLHTCKDCFCHTGQWKYLAGKVNRVYGYHIKRTNSAQEKGVVQMKNPLYKIKYIIKCKDCGAEIPRTRASKAVQHPECYYCTRCGGSLDVRKLV